MEKFKYLFNEGIVSSVAAFSFIKKLTTPFNKWELFKNGTIDEEGKFLKKNIKIPVFDGIARKIKRLFHKFLPGKKKYIALLLAMYLLKKEDIADPIEEIVKEELDNQLSENEKNILMNLLNEISNTTKGVGEYSPKFFVGKDLSDEEARRIGIKRMGYNRRGFGYNRRTGMCRFI